jgi:lysophospholipase L1-like esterase
MTHLRLKILLCASLVVNVLLIGAGVWVVKHHGGWSYLWGKLGLVDNEYSPTYWRNDQVAVFESMPRRKGQIVFLGDSLTRGYPWPEAFPGLDVCQRGIDGDTSGGVLARIDEALRGPPAKMFVMIGTNDLLRGATPRQVAENVREIISQARWRSPETRIYLQSVLPLPESNPDRNAAVAVAQLNRELALMARPPEVQYVDIYKAMADADGFLPRDLARDSVHINVKGYQVWRDQVAEFVAGAAD